MKRLRIAVIGGGHLGRIHAKILKTLDCFELVAVVDTCSKARESVREQLELPASEDYGAILPTIDAAIIATPTEQHYSIALDCLNQGVHTLIEKPITQSVQQADHLIHLADQQQLVLQVGHVERFNPAFEQARLRVPNPRYFEARRMSAYTFRSVDVGVVLDLMIHDIDLIASLVPSPLIETRAVGVAVFGPHEDIAQARLEFVDGTVANLTASRCSYQSERQIQWFSQAGFVSADLASAHASIVNVPETIRTGPRNVNQLTPDLQDKIRQNLFGSVLPRADVEVHAQNAIEEEQKDLFRAIAQGASPRVTGRHGRRALSIAQSIVDAIRAHRWTDGNSTRVGHKAERIQLLSGMTKSLEQKRAG